MQNVPESLRRLGVPCISGVQKMGQEITTRIRCARKCYHKLRDVLRRPRSSTRAKYQLYKLLIRPVLTYGCEIWRLNASYTRRRLLQFESEILIEIYKTTYYCPRHPQRARPDLALVYKDYRNVNVITYVEREILRWDELLRIERVAVQRNYQGRRPVVRWRNPCVQGVQESSQRAQSSLKTLNSMQNIRIQDPG